MKLFKTIAISILTIAILFGSVYAKRGRKLPVGAYLKSAKIEILSGDMKRYVTAIALLDSLFMHYGPHSEAMFLMGQIEVDYIDKTANPEDKYPHVERLVAYNDSLNLCCDKDNKDVKKKYKKDCKKFIQMTDSVNVKYWREFYNAAVEQMNYIKEIKNDISMESDSSVIERFNQDIKANVDSSSANYKLCLLLNESDARVYIGLGSLFEKVKDYDKAIEWMTKGLEYTEDRDKILLPIAYNYFNKTDYPGAIPYLKEYVDRNPEDTANMGYLVICYNASKKFDSSFIYNQHILSVVPENVDALNSIGHYYGTFSREANDSTRAYQDAGNDAKAKEWTEIKNNNIDSSITYYERSIASFSDDTRIHELYATYTYIRGQFVKAISSFDKLTELQPEISDHWSSLGDCYIQTKEFDKATTAYEKVVEIDPKNKAVWEQLVSLYGELEQPTKKAEAQKKLKSL